MDPITQGFLGAAAAQAVLGRKRGLNAWLTGAAGGMAADLDIFIRPASDPVAHIYWHRHYTHSLAFVPIGALLVLLPFLLFSRYRTRWRETYAAIFLGYATHGLLDAFTSYGTMLWWPFSEARVAWDAVAVIDLLFTVPLAIGVIASARKASLRPVLLALLYCVAYLSFGLVQNQRASAFQSEIARERGHAFERGRVFPTLGNLVVWQSLYDTGGKLYADTLRVSLTGEISRHASGELIKADLSEAAASLPDDGSRRALAIFYWFADGYVATVSKNPTVVGDARYLSDTAKGIPLWGMRIEPSSRPALAWQRFHGDRRPALKKLWRLIRGQP